ncbi:MAG: ribosomal RNA large subunit methyltransferase J [uncultured bacterium]|nr:MAG: ribosomal RNA large subunit methyltransferase J [uncultured bacterium]
MKKSKSSNRWLKEHFSDIYVKKAKQEGFRARSVYKLSEIQERYKIIKPNMFVVDLGAAPGGWSEYAVQLVAPKGKIFALDILPMQPIKGVDFIQGDFTQDDVVKDLHARLNGEKIDVVLSDMAPNLSGLSVVDQSRSINLVEIALAFAQKGLKPGGVFLTKIFQGAGFENFVKNLRHSFGEVKVIKPDASRARSKEIFLLARDFGAPKK